jgi:hypothetical protein
MVRARIYHVRMFYFLVFKKNAIDSLNALQLTRGKGLLKLASLGLVLDDKSVKVARTSNLELDTVRVLLDASGYFQM